MIEVKRFVERNHVAGMLNLIIDDFEGEEGNEWCYREDWWWDIIAEYFTY